MKKKIKKLGALINQFLKPELKKNLEDKDIDFVEKEIPISFIEKKISNPIENFEKTKTQLSFLKKENSQEKIQKKINSLLETEVKDRNEKGLPVLDGDIENEKGLPALDGDIENEKGLPALDGDVENEKGLPALDGDVENEKGLPALDGDVENEKGLPALDGDIENEKGLPALDGDVENEKGLPALDGDVENEKGLPALDGDVENEKGLPALGASEQGDVSGDKNSDDDLPNMIASKEGEDKQEGEDKKLKEIKKVAKNSVKFNLDNTNNNLRTQNFNINDYNSQEEEKAKDEKHIAEDVIKSNITNIPIIKNDKDDSLFERGEEVNSFEERKIEKEYNEDRILKDDLKLVETDIEDEISNIELGKNDYVDEEEVSNDTKAQVDSPYESDRVKEEKYEKAIAIISKYKFKNKKIIYEAINSSQISNDELNKILDAIIEKKNENYIAEKLSKKKLNKPIYEVLERRDKLITKEQKIFDEVFSKRKYFLFIKQLIYLVVFFVCIFSFYFITKDYIKSYRLYALAKENIEDNNFTQSEQFFVQAFNLKPNINKTREIAEIYAGKKEFLKAIEKYELALSLNKNDFATLLSYGDFYFHQKKFATAEEIYNRYLNNTSDYNLAEEIDKSRVTFYEKLGENYIQWGKVDSAKFENGKEVYNSLNQVNFSKKKFYYAKLLQIAALEKNYQEAKTFYLMINKDGEKEIFKSPYLDYLTFLNETFKNYNSLEFIEIVKNSLTEENNYMVATIEEMLRNLGKIYPQEATLFFEAAKWRKNTKENQQSAVLALKSLRLYQQEKPHDFPLANLYAFLGEINLEKNNNLEAVDYLENAIDINPNHALANYFLGKINFQILNNSQQAEEYFKTALNNWKEVKNGPMYLEILYSLGFIHYFRGKNQLVSSSQGANENFENSFKDSLLYWNDLSQNVSLQKSYLADYSLGLAYLYLGKYDLAESLFLVHFDELKKNYITYNNNLEGQTQDLTEIKKRLYILSDIYNNLGVINLKRSLDEFSLVDRNTFQKSINFFINSITLKDKLGIVTTIPTSNFHTINDNSLNRSLKNSFQIADEFLPRSILF